MSDVKVDVGPLIELGVVLATRLLTGIAKASLELAAARTEDRPLDLRALRPLLEQLDARDDLVTEEARAILAELQAAEA